MLGESHDQVVRILTQALAPQGKAAMTMTAPAAAPSIDETSVPWSGWPLVQRRIRLLQADALKIIVHSEAIVRDVA
jgi:hypothetical protein